MSNKKEKDEEKPIVAKTAVDLQRLKLMKLMKNPDKPVILPERPKPKNTPNVPEFVRNVMGSSAGAGSGEFHVYRHLRRKEYARQKFIQEKGHKELLDAQYHEKLEQNRKLAEEATAKKRAKRLKRKQKMKEKKKMKGIGMVKNNNKENSDSQHSNSDDSDTAEVHENKIQSGAMEIDQLTEVEDKEKKEIEDNENKFKEKNLNNVWSDDINNKNIKKNITSIEVDQVKKMEDKEENDVEQKVEYIKDTEKRESETEHKAEHEKEENKENGKVKEENKKPNVTITIPKESMDKETKDE